MQEWDFDIVPVVTRQDEVAHLAPDQWGLQVGRVLDMQEKLLRFLIYSQGIALAFTLPAFLIALFLTGFEDIRFALSDKVLMFLGGVTITGIGGLITTAITTFLKPPRGQVGGDTNLS